jgi:hypothetical protein
MKPTTLERNGVSTELVELIGRLPHRSRNLTHLCSK